MSGGGAVGARAETVAVPKAGTPGPRVAALRRRESVAAAAGPATCRQVLCRLPCHRFIEFYRIYKMFCRTYQRSLLGLEFSFWERFLIDDVNIFHRGIELLSFSISTLVSCSNLSFIKMWVIFPYYTFKACRVQCGASIFIYIIVNPCFSSFFLIIKARVLSNLLIFLKKAFHFIILCFIFFCLLEF